MSDATEPRARVHRDATRPRKEEVRHGAALADPSDAPGMARDGADGPGARFGELFDFAPFAYLTLAGDGSIKEINRAAATLLGLARAPTSAPFTLFVVAPDRERWAAHFSGLAGHDEALCVELSLQRVDGSVFAAQLSCRSHPGGAGEQQILVAITDISASRDSAEQLIKLWLAVEQTSQGIVITDLDARIEYVNDAFSEISGYSPAELLGHNPRMLRSGQTPAATYAQLWTTLARGETWHGEFINARRSGEIYIESSRISPVRQPDGRITHYLAIKEDITERKQASDAIRESKALLQGVIDATPDWIYVKDREHRFILVNEPLARAAGYTPAAMIGRLDSDFIPATLRFGDNDRGIDGLHDDDDAVLAGRSIHRPYDKVYFADGDERVFDTFKTPVLDASNVVRGCLCYRRDITERFNKEQQQRLLETQLRQAQKMELIGHLTGGIAHDFNNILAAVFGYAELVQMSPEIEKNPQLALYVQEILQAGIRAKELVAQLLTFSHRRELASQAINVTAIVREVAKLLRSTMPTSISIECALAEGLPEVLISPVQLHQILMNLGVNARDAIAGTGVVKIAAEQLVVDDTRSCASCHQGFSGRYLMISVRDSGSGIPAENMLRIFDPFFTTKEVGRGSGLGLSVLHGIVHSANGHIEVLTAPGQGSEFRVYLPMHQGEAASAPSELKADARSSRIRGRVMVVDDEASIVRFMTVLLEGLGCQVIGLTSPAEALQMFQSDPRCVDLVLTDQTMPELSGIELARAMIACRPDIPVVLSTGYSNVVDEDAARQVGVRRLLMKPVPAKVLSDVVSEYLAVRVGDHSA